MRLREGLPEPVDKKWPLPLFDTLSGNLVCKGRLTETTINTLPFTEAHRGKFTSKPAIRGCGTSRISSTTDSIIRTVRSQHPWCLPATDGRRILTVLMSVAKQLS